MGRVMRIAMAGVLGWGLASVAWASAGRLTLEVPGVEVAALGRVRAEVVRTGAEGGLGEVAFRGDAGELFARGIELSEGAYRVYLEDPETGLIVLVEPQGPGKGRGQEVKGGKPVQVTVRGFSERVREVKDKDRAEKRAWAEKGKGKRPGTLALGDEPGEPGEPPEGAEPEDHVPGDLLLKFGPGAEGLAERYGFFQELHAEPRVKLGPIGVYRVRVAEETDLQAIIDAHADDPRLAYVELNQVVSVPEPVEGDTRRE